MNPYILKRISEVCTPALTKPVNGIQTRHFIKFGRLKRVLIFFSQKETTEHICFIRRIFCPRGVRVWISPVNMSPLGSTEKVQSAAVIQLIESSFPVFCCFWRLLSGKLEIFADTGELAGSEALGNSRNLLHLSGKICLCAWVCVLLHVVMWVAAGVTIADW